MAQIEKYTSSEEIINRVFRDTNIQANLSQESLINWIFEVFELIGFPLQYIPKSIGYLSDDSYNFTDYKVKLPCDFHRLQAVSVDGYPVLPSQNTFNHLLANNCCTTTVVNGTEITFTDNFGNNFSNSQGIMPNTVSGGYCTFTINDNFISFSVKSGKACLAYWAIPVDKNGLPMIPDIEKYKIAVTKYLIMKLDYIGWRTGQVSSEVFKHSEAEYNWYIGSITSHLKMPNLEQMENLKNQIMRLKPNINEYNTFFANLNNPGSHRN